MNPLAIFQPKSEWMQDMKNRVLKNREAVLEAFSSTLNESRCCPFMCGARCLGKACEFFLEFQSISKTGDKTKFHRCAITEIPMLLIENAQILRDLINKIEVKDA
jgi:hypothetical protein